MAGFIVILISTLLAVFLFAGREFAGATEIQVYEIADASMSALWVITAIVCTCGHFRWRSQLGSNQEPRPSSVVGPESIGDEVQLGELGLVVAG